MKFSDDDPGFVSLGEAVPGVLLDIRYYSTFNFVGERIDADRFTRHAVRFQRFYCAIQVIDAEGKMTQATGFRPGRTRRRPRRPIPSPSRLITPR